ncbi:RNA 2',3'-cyclic phosphodiesterase [Pseudomonas sp. LS44]|uniref:RNA 2',3'-cyclic phosphodiesterase n=1 Tax=Pseudomonas sp. LS44 TaxID=1357074 RepID=UPI00215ABB65|nr:RNA 2',3'-cyclic phosphodiesterase [Pseudomonas sp. LS44]UVE19353.1 RNA 2',3'-cyclic phosphodiesterase [Pseudomonas sp. LS44]
MSTPPLRLFFALPCPPDLAHAVVAWRDGLALDGKPVAKENLHITLTFLGAQPRGRLDELHGLAAGIETPPFVLSLDSLGRWGNGLLYLAPSQVPSELLELEHELHERLLLAGFELETRRYRPHLTLARHCRRLPHAITPPDLTWQVEQFALFVSRATAGAGSNYQSVGQWRLGGNSKADYP